LIKKEIKTISLKYLVQKKISLKSSTQSHPMKYVVCKLLVKNELFIDPHHLREIIKDYIKWEYYYLIE